MPSPPSIWNDVFQTDVEMDEDAIASATTGVLHIASSSNPSLGRFHYWCTSRATIVEAMEFYRTQGSDDVDVTMYSSKEKWLDAYHTEHPITQDLTDRRDSTAAAKANAPTPAESPFVTPGRGRSGDTTVESEPKDSA